MRLDCGSLVCVNSKLIVYLVALWCLTLSVILYLSSSRPMPLLPPLLNVHLYSSGGPKEGPAGNGSLKYSTLLESLSKSIVVRRAYFDIRNRSGHENAVVFMVDVISSLTPNMFTGCRIGPIESSKVHYQQPGSYRFAIKVHHATKSVAIVDCFDVYGVRDGDPAFLKITHREIGSLEVKTVEVKSQGNVIVPQSMKDLSTSHPSVITCVATVRMAEIPPDDGGMLYQWIRYQKTIGVDHVHVIADDTVVTVGGFDHPIITEALKENFLSIDLWPRWFNTTEIYHSSQHLGSNDCVYRFQGVYDYLLIADMDDFFVPRGKSKSIKTYLKRWCTGKKASCNFQWHQWYPDCGWSPESVGPDGNLTTTVHTQKMKKIGNYKSAHQIQALVDVGRHSVKSVLPGYQNMSRVPFREAYFAHLRKGYKPRNGC